MQEQPMPPQGGAPGGGEGGGGVTELLVKTDAQLNKIAQAVGQSPAPDEAKAAFKAASDAFRQGLEALTGGGGEPQQQGTTTPEQGASGAVPMNPGRRG